MIPKTIEELAALLDLLAEKHVASISIGDLQITMLEQVEVTEEAEQVEEPNPPPEPEPAAEEPNPATGLTPTEEKDLFYSSGS